MLHDLSDQEFIHLIFTSQDRLGADYLEEAKGRRETIVPLLCAVLTDEENYRRQDEGLWSVIHGVNLLGILGNTRALEAVRAPEAELARHGFSPYFEPIFNQIDFTGDDEFGDSCGLCRSTVTPWPISSMPFSKRGMESRPSDLRSSAQICVPISSQLLVADHSPVGHPFPEGIENLLLEATRLLFSDNLYLPLSERPEGGVEAECLPAREH